MSQSPYSSEKMPWLAFREGWPPAAPSQVQVVISDLCNENCSFCAYRMDGYTSNQLFSVGPLASYGHNNPKRFMPTERALALLDEMKDAGVRAIQFTGGGEPTVHPDHVAIFRKAVAVGFECSLVTNGLKMSDDLIATAASFAWVRVSLDAGSAESYGLIRETKPENYHRVLTNISSLSKRIFDISSECVLGVGFVVTPENWSEIEAGILAAKEAGAHNVRLSAMFSQEDEKPYYNIYHGIRAAIATAKRHETEAFKVYDLFGDRIEDLRLGNPDYDICAKMHYCSYIGADLQTYMCCVYSYNEKGKVAGNFGNLRERSFKDFWESDERKKFMADFNPRSCERCQFNHGNRAMNALLGDAPTHVEFP